MSKHTYASHWYYDQVKDLVVKYLNRELNSEQFSNAFVDLKEKARYLELTNIMDAWHNGRNTANELGTELWLDKYLQNYAHNYE